MIEEKNREAEAAEADSAFEFEGDDTDGEGSSGILDQQTGTARSGTDGDDSDGAGSGALRAQGGPWMGSAFQQTD